MKKQIPGSSSRWRMKMRAALIFRAILQGWVCLFFASSCAYRQPGFKELEANLTSNTKSPEIHGMWRYSINSVHKYTRAVLFNPGGQGHWYFNAHDVLGLENEDTGTFTWKYNGGGNWSSSNIWGGSNFVWKMTKDRDVLLLTFNDMIGVSNSFIFRRVDE